MDAARFDGFIKALAAATGRRQVMRGVSGSAVAAALVLVGLRPVAATHGVCRHDGERCVTGSECCSGVCRKKRGTTKKFCRPAPGQGTCTTEQDACQGTSSSCNNSDGCNCQVRRNGYSVCTRMGACAPCMTDQECQNTPGFGPQAVCVRCLVCPDEGYTGCADPCPFTV